MTSPITPSKFDFAASELLPGLSVIEASAGTGKTYALSHLVPRLLLDGSLASLDQILLLTFTKDAAREFSGRVRRVLEKLATSPQPDEPTTDAGIAELRSRFAEPKHREIITRALLDIDRLGASTIHSFCQRIIQTEGPLCGWPVEPEVIPDSAEIIKDAIHELWEARIATDDYLSSIAAETQWKVSEDIEFASAMLSFDDYTTDPPMEPFDDALKATQTACAGINAASVAELEALLSDVTAWNSGAPQESVRNHLLASLRSAGAGYFTAVQQLSTAASWVHGSKAKKHKAAIGALEAVHAAARICDQLVHLRWQWKLHCVAQVRPVVASMLRKNRQVTFDGQISTVRDALVSPEHGPILTARLRNQYRVALIDESQDTDPRQFEIFRQVFLNSPGHRLVLIGDPKQAIYGFRGADVDTYIQAKKEAPESTFVLDKTYRSPQPLVSAVNLFFGRGNSFLKNGLSFFPTVSGLADDSYLQSPTGIKSRRLDVWVVPQEEAELYSNKDKRRTLIAGTVASEIVRILNAQSTIVSEGNPQTSRAVRPGDFAVLVSDHNEASAILDALRARGVPALQAKAADVMTSDEAGELLIILRAIEEPRRSGSRRAALATRLMGKDSQTLRDLQSATEEDDGQAATFLRWQGTFHTQGIAALLSEIDRSAGIVLRLAKLHDGERRITNLRQLTDLLQSVSTDLGNRPGRLVQWFAQEIARATTRTDIEERQQQLESDAEAVQIVTMHAAKGLEYDLVFCPFLWSAKSKSRKQSFIKISNPGAPPKIVNPALARDGAAEGDSMQRQALEDRLRLAYVAITRARVHVWIHAGDCTGATGPSALDWLLRADNSVIFETWLAAAAGPDRESRHTEGLANIASADSDNVIGYSGPPDISGERWSPPIAAALAMLSPAPGPAIPSVWGITSFSALTREKSRHAEMPQSRIQTFQDDARLTTQPIRSANAFASAPGGARMGTAIHDWIESWDFSEPDLGKLRSHLDQYQLPPMSGSGDSLPSAVSKMLMDLGATRLPELGTTVAVACNSPAASEWHFHLPIAGSLHPQALASAFDNFGIGATRDYAAQLAALSVSELQGYLQGFLDRLAIHDNQWGVIDWKTNRLGDSADAYDQDALMHCARQSHYLLQAHLYLVALRRYLGQGASIAGAWLIFLRGVEPQSSRGVLSICPPAKLLNALDALFSHR